MISWDRRKRFPLPMTPLWEQLPGRWEIPSLELGMSVLPSPVFHDRSHGQVTTTRRYKAVLSKLVEMRGLVKYSLAWGESESHHNSEWIQRAHTLVHLKILGANPKVHFLSKDFFSYWFPTGHKKTCESDCEWWPGTRGVPKPIYI